MAPTDEDRETLVRAVMGIPSILNVALIRERNRDAALDVARTIRQLHATARQLLGDQEADELVLPTLENVRKRITEVFGAAAWDEPPPPPLRLPLPPPKVPGKKK
jgi:hypothetical protein